MQIVNVILHKYGFPRPIFFCILYYVIKKRLNNMAHYFGINDFELVNEFGKHIDQIYSFLFELDFWEITELIGEEFDRKFSFKSKNGCFVLNCKLDGENEIYKIKRLSETDNFVECSFDTIFKELEKLEK